MEMWLDKSALLALPMRGESYQRVVAAAGKLQGPPVLHQDSLHNTNTFAAALVAARTQNRALANQVEQTLLQIGSVAVEDAAKKPLRCTRQLAAYILAFDVLDDVMPWSAASKTRFKAAVSKIFTHKFPSGHSGARTIIETALRRANNHGTMARMTAAAACLLLGDASPLDIGELAECHAAWCGERNGYDQLIYSRTTWHADPNQRCGINRRGATIAGHNVDGMLPEEQRRAEGQARFAWPPGRTNYVWGALQGALVCHVLLQRAGKVDLDIADAALLRAVQAQQRLKMAAEGDDVFLLHLANHLWPKARLSLVDERRPGKVLGFTSWTHSP